jgi:predicted nucleic acid-binding protein
VVDANVWVSALDRTELRSGVSRAFLGAVAASRHPIELPEFAEIEIACALSRRLRDTGQGRLIVRQALDFPLITWHPLSRLMIRRAVAVGTRRYLRCGDALYAAVAEAVGGEIVSWDEELVNRAGAVTPEAWVARHTD